MISYEYEAYEATPEDQYIKEIVTFKVTVKDEKTTECFYIPYFRKVGKDGQSFWDVATLGITKYGAKKYDDKFVWDSRNREKQIKNFLDNRLWETPSANQNHQTQQPQGQIHYPHGMAQPKEVAADEQLPF